MYVHFDIVANCSEPKHTTITNTLSKKSASGCTNSEDASTKSSISISAQREAVNIIIK